MFHSSLPPSFLCEQCGTAFKSRSNLYQHRRGMHIGNQYVCGRCNKQFNYHRSLKRHMKKMHSDIGHSKPTQNDEHGSDLPSENQRKWRWTFSVNYFTRSYAQIPRLKLRLSLLLLGLVIPHFSTDKISGFMPKLNHLRDKCKLYVLYPVEIGYRNEEAWHRLNQCSNAINQINGVRLVSLTNMTKCTHLRTSHQVLIQL